MSIEEPESPLAMDGADGDDGIESEVSDGAMETEAVAGAKGGKKGVPAREQMIDACRKIMNSVCRDTMQHVGADSGVVAMVLDSVCRHVQSILAEAKLVSQSLRPQKTESKKELPVGLEDIVMAIKDEGLVAGVHEAIQCAHAKRNTDEEGPDEATQSIKGTGGEGDGREDTVSKKRKAGAAELDVLDMLRERVRRKHLDDPVGDRVVGVIRKHMADISRDMPLPEYRMFQQRRMASYHARKIPAFRTWLKMAPTDRVDPDAIVALGYLAYAQTVRLTLEASRVRDRGEKARSMAAASTTAAAAAGVFRPSASIQAGDVREAIRLEAMRLRPMRIA